MTLETLFEKFDLFADAPDAVSKMRGLILRLAMQGKLSESHKSDGPVSELLGEVEKDKVRLGLENSANASRDNLDSLDDETADAIPTRWRWVRFGSIARHNAGKTLDKGRNRGELRDYVTTSNLYWGAFQLDAVRQMPISDDELERCTAIKGDLLICEGGEAGRAAVWPHDREISFQNHVHRARFFAGINPYFVQRFFEKLNATGEIEKYRKGVGISNMSGKALASIPIPLPPLAEQKRIVAKVDELMALCDRLEAQQQERETRHAGLARASLARFADAPTPANLNFLFHSSYTIPPSDLRKSILTLAVQGKLVPQDPNDEPAEEVVKRIRSEKSCLVAAGELKREKAITKTDNSVVLYDLPNGWCWSQLGDLSLTVTSGSRNWAAHYSNEGAIFVRMGNLSRNSYRLRMDKIQRVAPPSNAEGDRTRLEAGDILISITGEVGLLGLIPDGFGEAYINQHTCLVRLPQELQNRFIPEFFRSPFAQEYFNAPQRGLKNSFRLTDVTTLPIPLPPIAEQRRIVAKVEQLMALVDQSEAQLTQFRATAEKLMEAVVAELTAH